jgi:hypothetical protein
MFRPPKSWRVVADNCLSFATEAVKKRLEPDTGESEHDLIRAFLKNGLEPEDIVQECITLV